MKRSSRRGGHVVIADADGRVVSAAKACGVRWSRSRNPPDRTRCGHRHLSASPVAYNLPTDLDARRNVRRNQRDALTCGYDAWPKHAQRDGQRVAVLIANSRIKVADAPDKPFGGVAVFNHVTR